MQFPCDDGGHADYAKTDLPEALAETERRLRQLRPCPPQIDFASVERIATADPARVLTAAGVSKKQLFYAVAASWLCGVTIGAAALHFANPRKVAVETHDRKDATALAPPASLAAAMVTGQQQPDAQSGLVIDQHDSQPQVHPKADALDRDRQWVALILDDPYQRLRVSRGSDPAPLHATSFRRWQDVNKSSSSPLAFNQRLTQRNESAIIDRDAVEARNKTNTPAGPAQLNVPYESARGAMNRDVPSSEILTPRSALSQWEWFEQANQDQAELL
jgi:hypothetical protein